MSRVLAVSTLLILAGSPALALADLPTGPSPRPYDEPPKEPEPTPPEPAPPSEPPLDTGPMEVERPPEGDEDAKAEGGDKADAKAEGGEDKGPDHPEKTSDGGPKPKTDAKAETKKSGSCSVEDETSSLLGFAALALLLSGVALRRREDA